MAWRIPKLNPLSQFKRLTEAEAEGSIRFCFCLGLQDAYFVIFKMQLKSDRTKLEYIF